MKWINQCVIPIYLLTLLCMPGIAICENQQISRLTIAALLLLLVQRVHSFKLETHHWLFVVWLGWSAICALFSEHAALSFYGFFPYRGDGLLTWLLITCAAVLYWSVYKSLRALAVTSLVAVALLLIGYAWVFWFKYDSLGHGKMFYDKVFVPEVAIGSFMCQASIICAEIFPPLAFAGLLPIINSSCRSALIAWACGTVIYLLYSYRRSITPRHVAMVAGCLALALVSSPLWIGRIENKIARIPDLSKAQLGARPQWILQADYLAHRLPLTGYGLDTLSNHLSDAKGSDEIAGLRRYIPDRTHNVAFDAILMTGWIGYTLLLLVFGRALGVAIKFPTRQNVLCMSAVTAYVLFGMLNPHGLLGNLTAVICLFGIRKTL